MGLIGEQLLERATTVPWSPGWAAVLDAYRVGLEQFPRPFRNRTP